MFYSEDVVVIASVFNGAEVTETTMRQTQLTLKYFGKLVSKILKTFASLKDLTDVS